MSNTTLLEISQMQDDTWINGDVHCIVDVQQPKMSKAGKPFYPLLLTDPDDASAPAVSTTAFQDHSKFHGKICVLTGKGNKKTSYNGKAQIGIGKQGYFKIVGDAAPSMPAPLPRGAVLQQGPRPDAPTAAAPLRHAPTSTVNGQSIGMAVKEAHLSILKSGQPLTEDAIVALAGIFLRASSRLERGEHMQQASQPVKRPQAGPGGQASPPPQENIDEDVPF
jgi:hypothetical protein